MLFKNAELFNVAEILPAADGRGGVASQVAGEYQAHGGRFLRDDGIPFIFPAVFIIIFHIFYSFRSYQEILALVLSIFQP